MSRRPRTENLSPIELEGLGTGLRVLAARQMIAGASAFGVTDVAEPDPNMSADEFRMWEQNLMNRCFPTRIHRVGDVEIPMRSLENVLRPEPVKKRVRVRQPAKPAPRVGRKRVME